MILTKCFPNRKVKKEGTYMGDTFVAPQVGLVWDNSNLGIILQCS